MVSGQPFAEALPFRSGVSANNGHTFPGPFCVVSICRDLRHDMEMVAASTT
jgi:hypothetical protein